MLEQRGNKWYIWREKARNHYLKEEKSCNTVFMR